VLVFSFIHLFIHAFIYSVCAGAEGAEGAEGEDGHFNIGGCQVSTSEDAYKGIERMDEFGLIGW